MKLATSLVCLFCAFVLEMRIVHANNDNSEYCSKSQLVLRAIGGVVEEGSRVGREQKIAMEMAVNDICRITKSACCCPVLHLKDSHGSSARSVYEVMKLMEGKQVEAIIGTISPEEATLIVEFDKTTKNIPIVSLAPTATFSLPQSVVLQSFVQMSHDEKIHMQCIAAIISHFNWRKVTPIYEDHNTFSSSPGLLTHLSDALQLVGSTIDCHFTFPPLHSVQNMDIFVEEKLKKLKMKGNRVFILLQSSLDSSILLFKKAKELGMMEKGYVWIISDDVSSLLDSVNQSIILSMQGVVGIKTYFDDTSDSFRDFKLHFRNKFRTSYPNEEYSNPSIYAVRAYDATWALVKSIQVSNKSCSSKDFLQSFLHIEFDGVSGNISFKDGKLAQLLTFRIINVIGRSYREIDFWSPQLGFYNDIHGSAKASLDLIYWPGGTQRIPTGQVHGNEGKPLKIGVPAKGAFNQFVKVRYDPVKNTTYVTGFSIEVFEAAVKHLPYSLSYIYIPYNGSYDEMVAEVHKKNLDAAVGDTEIMADRYEYAEFSQPYMDSGLVRVVPVNSIAMKEEFIFLYAFTTKMWIILLAMTIGTVSIVWFNEHVHGNEDFKASSPSECISRMLWFAVSVLSLAHREVIRNNLSRLVLATWFCINVIVAACFTATLSSIMTVSTFQQPLDHLRNNDVVGCNGNSFIVRYLVNVLHYKPENIKNINSIDDYPEAFKNGEIAIAFFVSPHANVFLAKYCDGYEKIEPTYKLGGFGFVFRKGSTLVEDISEAVLKLTQNGEINTLNENMLKSFSNCSRLDQESKGRPKGLGTTPFTGLFMISGSISSLVFFTTLGRLVAQSQGSIWNLIQSNLIVRRIGKWLILLLLRIRVVQSGPSVDLTPNQETA